MLCQKVIGQKFLDDDATLGADFQALVAGGNAGLLARLAVLTSGSRVLDLGGATQVAESAESLAVGRGIEGEVPLAGGEPLREALVDWKHRFGNILWSSRDSGSKGQESNDKLHHGNLLVQASFCG